MNQLYQEDSRMIKNLKKHRKEHAQRIRDSGRHFINDPLRKYREKVKTIALQNNKPKSDWQCDDIFCADSGRGTMTHKSAAECLEREQNKLSNLYETESKHLNEIHICEDKLIKLSRIPESKKTTNQITTWIDRKIIFETQLEKTRKKIHTRQKRAMKWTSIIEAIKIGDAGTIIQAERNGHGNKYGFNPNMQDRATATDLFKED